MSYATRVIAVEESEKYAEFAESIENAKAAVIREKEAAAALVEAEDELSSVAFKVKMFDPDTTAIDLAEATTAVQFAELRAAGSRRLAAQAAHRVNTVDTRAAEVAATALSRELSGVTVLPTFVTPPSSPWANELPVLVIRQLDNTTVKADGTLGADLEFLYYRNPAVHTELDQRQMEAAADRAGLPLNLGGYVRPKGEGLDTINGEVRGAHAAQPVILTLDPRIAVRVGGAVSSAIVNQARYYDESIYWDVNNGGLATCTQLAALPVESAVIDVDEDEDGNRVARVQVDVVVKPSKRNGDRARAAEDTSTALDSLPGRFIAGLGIIESVEVESMPDRDAVAAGVQTLARATHEIIPTSEAGFEDFHGFGTRVVITAHSRTRPEGQPADAEAVAA